MDASSPNQLSGYHRMEQQMDTSLDAANEQTTIGTTIDLSAEQHTLLSNAPTGNVPHSVSQTAEHDHRDQSGLQVGDEPPVSDTGHIDEKLFDGPISAAQIYGILDSLRPIHGRRTPRVHLTESETKTLRTGIISDIFGRLHGLHLQRHCQQNPNKPTLDIFTDLDSVRPRVGPSVDLISYADMNKDGLATDRWFCRPSEMQTIKRLRTPLQLAGLPATAPPKLLSSINATYSPASPSSSSQVSQKSNEEVSLPAASTPFVALPESPSNIAARLPAISVAEGPDDVEIAEPSMPLHKLTDGSILYLSPLASSDRPLSERMAVAIEDKGSQFESATVSHKIGLSWSKRSLALGCSTHWLADPTSILTESQTAWLVPPHSLSH